MSGWFVLDGIRVPTISFGDQAYCPERTIRHVLLHVFRNVYELPLEELYSPLACNFMTADDALRFNSIELGEEAAYSWMRDFAENEGMVRYDHVIENITDLNRTLIRLQLGCLDPVTTTLDIQQTNA